MCLATDIQGCAFCRQAGHNAIACPELRSWVIPSQTAIPARRYAGRGRLLHQLLTAIRLLATKPLTIAEFSRQLGLGWRTGYRLIEQLIEADTPIEKRQVVGRGGAQTYSVRHDEIRRFLFLDKR